MWLATVFNVRYHRTREPKRPHDQSRNGTTTVLAGLSMVDECFIAGWTPCHRYPEFILDLKQIGDQTPVHSSLHRIAYNDGANKHLRVQRLLDRDPRFRLHLVSTFNSCLNPVERWSRYQSTKRIRRGRFAGLPGPVAAINHQPTTLEQGHLDFDRSALVESVLARMTICEVALDAPYSLGAGGSRAR
jgi:hypothetical protein